jgi:hypothetical protein
LVRCRDEDDAVVGLEAVHLDEELIERLLTFVVSAAQTGTAMTADGIDLVDEDDARRVGLALLEQVAHSGGADADEHLHEVGAGHGEERTTRLAGDRTRKECLASSRRADQKRALREASTQLRELLRITEELDNLLQLLFRLVRASHVGESDFGSIAGEQLCFGLSERKRLRTAGLHLSEQEQIEADQEQPGQEAHHVIGD